MDGHYLTYRIAIPSDLVQWLRGLQVKWLL